MAKQFNTLPRKNILKRNTSTDIAEWDIAPSTPRVLPSIYEVVMSARQNISELEPKIRSRDRAR